MKKWLLFLTFCTTIRSLNAQTTQNRNASEILLDLKKLNVLGSVLYIGAHPDDENTQLLSFLSKEKLYRTAYLSLTRGDGGQNLIGDEQGIELGLIRTQELLSARKIDGAEQFFSRAYDFGYSKKTEEALRLWDEDKILSDVVWVIRKFQPDVIITRFPEDSRAGHGQHSASAVLAHKAYFAAADPLKFPEQFKYGVKPWQAKRLFWNTFRFFGANTTSEDQFKINIGGYNPLLGKSYGEIAANSRSMHKSQGFGFFSSRGDAIDYFSLTEGERPEKELLDGVVTEWTRVKGGAAIATLVNNIIRNYSVEDPSASVNALVELHRKIASLPEGYWRNKKLDETEKLIKACSGLYIEAATPEQYGVQGDSLSINFSVINRGNAKITLNDYSILGDDRKAKVEVTMHSDLVTDKNLAFSNSIFISSNDPVSQPYWLVHEKTHDYYTVIDQQLIGKPWNDPPLEATFNITIAGETFSVKSPVLYKFRDPVLGEVYEPISIVPPLSVKADPEVKLGNGDFKLEYKAYTRIDHLEINSALTGHNLVDDIQGTGKNQVKFLRVNEGLGNIFPAADKDHHAGNKLITESFMNDGTGGDYYEVRNIEYNHIPGITYFKKARINFVLIDNLRTVGKKIGYINGAGDKVAEALQQLGYEVTFLQQHDITPGNLKQFDAVVTGVRAYNTNEWMSEVYDALMQYVKDGGNLVVQYNTVNFAGPLRNKVAPYFMHIANKRVTDETAVVHFTEPEHSLLRYPNTITEKDFEGWIQERSVYEVDSSDSHFENILSMSDPGEAPLNGSLVTTDYGKGRFVYCALALFRQLPAGVPGAYRLLANIVANKNEKEPAVSSMVPAEKRLEKLN